MQIWAESGKSALPICNYSQILYQFLTFTQNLKRSPNPAPPLKFNAAFMSGVVSGIPREAPLPRASADLVLPDLYFLFRHNTSAAP